MFKIFWNILAFSIFGAVLAGGQAALAQESRAGEAAQHTQSTTPPRATERNVAPLLNQDSPTAIAGQYIVVLREDFNGSVSDFLSGLTILKLDAIKEIYDSAGFKGFSATLSPDQLNAVRAHAQVEFVELDQTVHPEQTLWNLDRIDQRDLPLDTVFRRPAVGNMVTVFVIDSGIQANHAEFAGIQVGGRSFVGGNFNVDTSGHGTHVAGTIAGRTVGVAQNVALSSVRVFGNGGAPNSTIIAAVTWITNNPLLPSVANMSLGSPPSEALNSAIAASIRRGVVYVVAAGNDSADACTTSPANFAPAITVGATDHTDERSVFSNIGSCVDIFAPGSNIISANNNNLQGYVFMSGTSMAAPHVAGFAAVALGAMVPAQDVDDLIMRCATLGRLGNIGVGSPNALLFVNTLSLLQCPGFVAAGSWARANFGSGKLGWYVGDYNGDGADDLLRQLSGIGVQVFLADPLRRQFLFAGNWTGAGSGNGPVGWYVGDFNCDGSDDIFRYLAGRSGAEVFLADGQNRRFVHDGSWTGAGLGKAKRGWYVGDFDGNGCDDIFRYLPGTSGADVFLANPAAKSFGNHASWTGAGYGSAPLGWYVGDFNGDGRDDIFRYVTGRSGADMFLSDPTQRRFKYSGSWTGKGRGSSPQGWYVGDFNGDGADDIFRYRLPASGAEVFIASPAENRFRFAGSWTGESYGAATDGWYVGNFDGLRGDDILRYVPGRSTAEVFLSNGLGPDLDSVPLQFSIDDSQYDSDEDIVQEFILDSTSETDDMSIGNVDQ
jgi:subtilisin family serine protease